MSTCFSSSTPVTVKDHYESRMSLLKALQPFRFESAPSMTRSNAFVKTIAIRVQRAARSVRSSVRQTFTARKAAKAADSGGGSSDPDGRRPHTRAITSNTLSPASAFLLGGAK